MLDDGRLGRKPISLTRIMQRIRVGMRVNGVSDLPLGTVSQVRSCCFEVQPLGQVPHISLTPAAIFDVQISVTLMCMNSDIARYACPIHGRRPSTAVG
jgi:hypothetical protein